MSDRCSGHCCRHFFLPFTPAELRETYEREVASSQWVEEYSANLPSIDENDRSTWSPPLIAKMPPHLQGPTYEDLQTIAGMVVYIGDTHHKYGQLKHGGIYTCRHLQPSGDCGNYNNRPRMCRDYPYGNPCEWGDDCHWDAAREGSTPTRSPCVETRGTAHTVFLKVLQGNRRRRAEGLNVILQV